MRTGHDAEVPDVSYNAAIYNGVIVAWNGAFYRFGGTSAGSPQWAAHHGDSPTRSRQAASAS